MLEKLAKQTAVYGLSTIVVRFLSYLLAAYYTYVFSPETYGIVTDVYALIPFALVLLSMGMESSYFRFTAKAEAAGGDVAEAKRRIFATAWGATLTAAAVFFAIVVLFRDGAARLMGAAYAGHSEYVVLTAAVVLFDVAAMIPFSRLREQGRAGTFVMLKVVNVAVNVIAVFSCGAAGLFAADSGVIWVLASNLAASAVTLILTVRAAGGVAPRIDRALLVRIFAYSLPLLVSGIAGTANEFIDRQLIKYILPQSIAMSQLGFYGAITKIAVVMTLFTQMYRLAAEPFFLANFRKDEFTASNAAALKYYVMASMAIFLGIALFRDAFALIVGRDFREGIFILPVVLGANVLSGVWLNMSFWYKREEKTRYAAYITFTGLFFSVAFNLLLLPRYGYYGAAWARLVAEAAMVWVSWRLNRRYCPTPYDFRRMAEYVALALALFAASEAFARLCAPASWLLYAVDALLFTLFLSFAVRRERIDVQALVASMLHMKR